MSNPRTTETLTPARLEELGRLHRLWPPIGDPSCAIFLTGSGPGTKLVVEMIEAFPALLAAARERDELRAHHVADLTGHMYRCAKVNGEWSCHEGCAMAQLATLTAERDEARQHRSMSEEDWTYFLAAQAKVYAAVEFAENVEAFIRALPWTTQATEDEQTLVAGNLRNFAARLLDAIREAEVDEGSSKPAGTRAQMGHEDTEQGAPTNAGESPAPSAHARNDVQRAAPLPREGTADESAALRTRVSALEGALRELREQIEAGLNDLAWNPARLIPAGVFCDMLRALLTPTPETP